MDTQEKLAHSRIAAEDIIADFERIINRTRAAIIRRPARVIHAENHELFRVQHAIANSFGAAAKAKAELLEAIGMPPTTWLTTFPKVTER